MAHHGVPGVSIAVIDEGRICWAGGAGVVDRQRGTVVDEHTLFQAASMSKPVAAAAVLRAVEEGHFDLDAPVNDRLTSWRIPDNDLTRRTPVTLRHILSHTGGLTVWGFGGYPQGASLPTLPEVLSGAPPANSPPVFVDTLPGTRERYSGGGTTIAQLALQEAFGQPYEEILRQLVLQPLGMQASTFAQPLPEALADRAAAGHDVDGHPIAGLWHVYPEQAAAGLWTTASDYARFLIGLQRAYRGEPGALLRPETAQDMATVPTGGGSFGLGPKVIGRGRARRFQHGGSNAGYICGSSAFLDGSRGVVVLTNSDAGATLAEEIIIAVATVFGWPDYLRAPRPCRALTAADAGRYAGRYRLGAGAPFPTAEVGADGEGLWYRLGAQRPRRLLAESAERFFSPETLYDTVFRRDSGGRIRGFSVEDGERVILNGERMDDDG